MKYIWYFILALTISVTARDAGVEISGFGQAKLDLSNFTIPKVRLQFVGSLIKSNWIDVGYITYGDFNSKGAIVLGYASLIGKFKQAYLPEIIAGRYLDPVSFQFPAPALLPILNYPKSYMNIANDNGIFLRQTIKNFWYIVGVGNGSGNYQDNNKNLDFTSRFTYVLPFNFVAGFIYRNGKQPEGNRLHYGGDITWKLKSLWLNFGYNVMNFQEKQQGNWIFITYNVLKWLQLAGMYEDYKIGGIIEKNWSVGINLIPTEKTLVKFNKFNTGWGILFQHSF